MTIGSILFFILASYGLSNIVLNSEMGEGIRELLRPVPWIGRAAYKRCYMCFGFWTGIFCSPILYITGHFSWSGFLFFTLLAGFVSSGVLPAIRILVSWLEIEDQVRNVQ